ncbi:hypothetical protein [Maridesulfovibrio hydrothermalis]|uniref:Lipoprotein n=1 Tax=Maridesulfovibrio hydrothermalis AM13 = DSM 14728 TaxID=1121451 RepID=L0RD17_9BACT|nr:hypothetical protein [Maridesulfovibrio hydrothermalis]CCO23426.1 conserved exported protein of unknown function [Maridesulfovibrio hydrothermalis AM13 = DSM 14728]
MHNYPARKICILLFILTVLASAGCATRKNTPQATSPATGLTYRLQHSGVLAVAGKRLLLRGMIQYSPQDRRVKVVMLNDMGMKLLVAEIRTSKDQGYETTPVFISPFLRAIPHFYDESMRCIYELYLVNNAAKGKTHKNSPLQINCNGIMQIGSRAFAKHTSIKNIDKNYTLELFLNSGSEVGS